MIAALEIAGLIFVSYTLISINTCAMAKGRYLPTVVSNVLFMMVNFFLIQHIASAHSALEFGGYLVGGSLGDLAGIYLSRQSTAITAPYTTHRYRSTLHEPIS